LGRDDWLIGLTPRKATVIRIAGENNGPEAKREEQGGRKKTKQDRAGKKERAREPSVFRERLCL